jgi:phenylacetic acid degradation protein
MHGVPRTDTRIEVDGHIGHSAVLRGRTIKRNAMVGMNAVVMDEAVVGESAIVAACALVKAAMIIPPRRIATGVPVKVLRELSDEQIEWKRSGTRRYQALTLRSLATMREVEPLAAPDPGRCQPDAAESDAVPLVALRKG